MRAKGWFQKEPHHKWHYFYVQDGRTVAGPALCGKAGSWCPSPGDLVDTLHYSWHNCDKCKQQRRMIFPDEPDRPTPAPVTPAGATVPQEG